MPTPRRYPPELCERAIRMAVDARRAPATRDGAIARVADRLGIDRETLRNRVTQAEADAGHRPGTTTDQAHKIAELERGNRALKRTNAILKSASAFFTAELDHPHTRWSPTSTSTARSSGSNRSARCCRSPRPPTTRPRTGPRHCVRAPPETTRSPGTGATTPPRKSQTESMGTGRYRAFRVCIKS
ncbi:transposase [Nocardiopsis sp. CC223A]|uniref:transposase n=1 Tax=Nocardiopsis sp. CC223A TaxID=3044051 RepID=UPI0035590152